MVKDLGENADCTLGGLEESFGKQFRRQRCQALLQGLAVGHAMQAILSLHSRIHFERSRLNIEDYLLDKL